MDTFLQLPASERQLYFEQAGAQMRLAPHLVEKDFWVCWTLKELFALPNTGKTLIFKGGTSLSKVYGAIQRFSEDIDVSIDRASLGFGEDHDPEANVSRNERKRRIDALKAACQDKVINDIQPAVISAFTSKFGTDKHCFMHPAKRANSGEYLQPPGGEN